MDAETKSRVRNRAGNRCEYCRIHQQHYIITFHVEHIVAQQHHGGTVYVLNMNRLDRVRVRLELEPETFLG